MSHYQSIYLCYSLSGLFYYFFHRNFFLIEMIQTKEKNQYNGPILQIVIAVFTILLFGQLYTNNYLFTVNNENRYIIESINQTIIFSAIPISLLIYKESLNTVWLSKNNAIIRFLVGVLISLILLFIYSIVKKDAFIWSVAIRKIWDLSNLHLFVQVFWEDIAVAFVSYRLINRFGKKKSLIIAAMLFSLLHIPAMISNSVDFSQFYTLIFDAILVFGILWYISSFKDILWFIPIHFTFDMTQFTS